MNNRFSLRPHNPGLFGYKHISPDLFSFGISDKLPFDSWLRSYLMYVCHLGEIMYDKWLSKMANRHFNNFCAL